MAWLRTTAKWFGITLGVALGALGITYAVLRMGDGPTAIVAGGAFSTGQPYAGGEPEWSFLRDRQEVEFQLLDPARSRTTWILEHAGRIYIPCGYMNSTLGKLWKHWPYEAERNGDALLRVDGVLYERRLVRIKDAPELPAIASELARKYIAVGANETQRAAAIAAILGQVQNNDLWVFELQPRSS